MSNMEPSQRLRGELVDFLQGKTDAGENVYKATLNIEEAKLPVINVFTPSELVVDDLLVITLEVYVFATANVDGDLLDELDPLVAQVKAQLKEFDTDRLMESLAYIGRDNTIDDSGESLLATAKLTFEASVFNEN